MSLALKIPCLGPRRYFSGRPERSRLKEVPQFGHQGRPARISGWFPGKSGLFSDCFNKNGFRFTRVATNTRQSPRNSAWVPSIPVSTSIRPWTIWLTRRRACSAGIASSPTVGIISGRGSSTSRWTRTAWLRGSAAPNMLLFSVGLLRISPLCRWNLCGAASLSLWEPFKTIKKPRLSKAETGKH